jgi:hypothetical protein
MTPRRNIQLSFLILLILLICVLIFYLTAKKLNFPI